MGAVLGKCLGQLDDNKITLAVDKGFDFFDKDKSGFIEGSEFKEAVRKAVNLTGPIGKKVTDEHINGAYAKIAGTDGKVDKAEFGRHVRALIEKAGGPKASAAAADAGAPAAAPVSAAAAADAAEPAAARA
jgi:hypothetical protein